MKKYILAFGSVATAVAPAAAVIACSKDDDKEKSISEKIKDKIENKVIFISVASSAKTGDSQLTDIKAKIKMELKDIIKVDDVIEVKDKDKGTTAAAITGTIDADAIKYHVTVKDADDELIVEDVVIKVRKATTAEEIEIQKEINKMKVKKLKEAIETVKSDAGLDLSLIVTSGVDSVTAYSKAELLVSLKNKLKATPTFDTEIDGIADEAFDSSDSDVTITLKTINGTTIPASGSDDITSAPNLGTARDLVLEIKSTSTDKHEITIKVKAT